MGILRKKGFYIAGRTGASLDEPVLRSTYMRYRWTYGRCRWTYGVTSLEVRALSLEVQALSLDVRALRWRYGVMSG
jgi:hypothetical protein